MLTDLEILNFGPGQEDAPWPYDCQLYFAREVEKAARAQDAQVILQLVRALEWLHEGIKPGPDAAATIETGRAWLRQNKEAPHATPA